MTLPDILSKGFNITRYAGTREISPYWFIMSLSASVAAAYESVIRFPATSGRVV